MRKIFLAIYSGMVLFSGPMMILAGEETVVATNTMNEMVKAGETIQKVNNVFKARLESVSAARITGGLGGVFLPRGVKWETDAPTKELNEGNPIYGNRDYRYGAVPAGWHGLKIVQGMADQNMSFRITFSEPVSSEIYFVNPRENLKIETISRRLACFRVPPAASPLQTDSRSAWDGADRLTGFLRFPELVQMETSPQTEAAFMHDDQCLYFMCRATVPDKYRLVAKAEGKDGNIWEDDIIELFLQPETNSEKYFQLAFNSRNAVWDAKDEKTSVSIRADAVEYRIKNDPSWDSGAEVVNQWTPGAPEWVLRVKIPFKALGISSVPPGAQWRINVCRSIPQPDQKFMSWAFLGQSQLGFQTPEAFRPMVFSGPNSNKGMGFPGLSGSPKIIGEYNEVSLGAWIVKGTAEARPDGGIVLKDRDSAAEQSICINNIAKRRFVCILRCRADEQDIPMWLSFFYRDARGTVRELRVFEYAQTLPVPTGYREEIVFPKSAVTLEKIRLGRGEHNGSVSVENVIIASAPNAYDFIQRQRLPYSPSQNPRMPSGPTRLLPEGAAEIFFWSPRPAVAVDVPAPLDFGLITCVSLSNAPKGRVVFDFPPEIPDPYLVVRAPPGAPGVKGEHFYGKPEKTGQSTIDGITYTRYAAPIFLRYSTCLLRDAGFLYVKADCAPGSIFRIGYFLEWEGGAQPERWLEVEAISIPEGPPLKKFMVGALIGECGQYERMCRNLPGYAELWRRSGMNAVELWQVGNYHTPEMNPIPMFSAKGIKIIAEFGPGENGGYQNAVVTNQDMQGRGIDGQTAILEHNRIAPCPSYRGEAYCKQLEFFRNYIKTYQLNVINQDEEYWCGAITYCFCDRCKGLFKKYLQKKNLPELAPEEIVKNKAQHPEHYQAWVQFKADLATEWFRDYRRVVDEEWAKLSPAGKVEMYTCAGKQVEKDKEEALRDYAALLGEDLVQRGVPQLYLYAPQYKGVSRGIGDDLMELQRILGVYRKGAQALYLYLLGGTGGSGRYCLFYPPEVMKYQVWEALTSGAINGFTIWPKVGDPWHWKYLAEALHAVARVEDILWDGKVEVLPCALPSAGVRVIRKGDEAVLFVTEYGYEPVDVPVVLPVNKTCLVTDVETGELVAEIKPNAKPFIVRIDRERARLLKVTPQPSFFEKIFSSISGRSHE